MTANQKHVVLLDEKIKNLGRAAAGGGGGGGIGAALLEDLEAALAKVREDLDNHKSEYSKDQGKVKDELEKKATKEELADLEARMMQRLQDMFDQLRQMFPDKEAIKKKLAAIEKNVRQRRFALSQPFNCNLSVT